MNRMFWDIETSPNIMFSWRCGRKLTLDYHNIIQERAIICICWKWEGEKVVHALTWDAGDDKAMLEAFSEEVKLADEMVAHNGDNFDIKWFNSRRLVHDLEPLPPAKTIDTLKIARRHFNFNSNRLDYLGSLLLEEGKIKTEFDMWRQVVLRNDAASLRKMVRYCKKDVVLLERVWQKLRDYEQAATHAGVLKTGIHYDRWTCPHCASANVSAQKKRATATGIVKYQMQCKDCGRYYQVARDVHAKYVRAKYRTVGDDAPK